MEKWGKKKGKIGERKENMQIAHFFLSFFLSFFFFFSVKAKLEAKKEFDRIHFERKRKEEAEEEYQAMLRKKER